MDFEVSLDDVIDNSFGQYAGAVIQSRALVDVRDCVKPSTRQVLYCMFTDKFTHDKPFKKTLKVYVLKSDDSIRVTDCCFKKSSISVSAGKKTSQDIIFNPDDAECKYASWTSSDESVARVDENGVITGISKGTAIITAYTFDGQFEDYYVVKVKRSFGQWVKYYILFGWTKKQ